MTYRFIAISLLAAMICAAPIAASAYAGVVLNVEPVSDSGSFHTVQVGVLFDDGTGNPTTNGYDEDSDYQDTMFAMPGQIEMDVINSVIGDSGVQRDFRSPDLPQIWRLTTFVANNMMGMGGQFGLNMYFNPGMAPDGDDWAVYVLDGDYLTEAACRAAIDTNLVTTISSSQLSYSGGSYNLPEPVFDETTGQYNTPSHNFTIFAANVPEPSSLLAFFTGAVGMVGFVVRRRR